MRAFFPTPFPFLRAWELPLLSGISWGFLSALPGDTSPGPAARLQAFILLSPSAVHIHISLCGYDIMHGEMIERKRKDWFCFVFCLCLFLTLHFRKLVCGWQLLCCVLMMRQTVVASMWGVTREYITEGKPCMGISCSLCLCASFSTSSSVWSFSSCPSQFLAVFRSLCQ